MDENVKKALDAEIQRQIESLSQCEPGTEESDAIIENIEALYRLRLEEEKLDKERDEIFARSDDKAREIAMESRKEKEIQEIEIKNKRIDKLIEIGASGIGVAANLWFFGLCYFSGLQFEQTGVFTSTVFKNFMHFIKPVK